MTTSSAPLSAPATAALLLGFEALAFVIYAPALTGPLISDDTFLFLNPYVQHPTLGTVLALLDPRSQATLDLVNYAPVRPLLQALLWKISPQNFVLYHCMNVVLHGVATTLLVRFLQTLGVPLLAAGTAGLFFLVHPANVEAVAWMCQFWSPLALIFSLLALLWLRRRPALATFAFALALLTKPMAVFSLPVAAVLEWTHGPRRPKALRSAEESPTDRSRWPWITAWVALCGLYITAQIFTYTDAGQIQKAALPLDVRVRFMAVLALRYLLMAATSYGVSTAQEPPIPRSWLDPWWLASLPVLALLGVRLARALRARSAEAAGWTFALAAFAPVSQIFLFLYPMADRYLYFMLPGLLAGGLLAGGDRLRRVASPPLRRGAEAALVAGAVALCALFSYRSAERAHLWQSEGLNVQDAIHNFPDGISAHLQHAAQRGQVGDADGEMRELRAAADRGFTFSGTALLNPGFRRLREDPRYRPLLLEITGATLDLIESKRRQSQMDLRETAICRELRGEMPQALEALRRGLALGGSMDGLLRAELERLEGTLGSSHPPESQAR